MGQRDNSNNCDSDPLESNITNNNNHTNSYSKNRTLMRRRKDCLGLLNSLRISLELAMKALTLLAWCIMITIRHYRTQSTTQYNRSSRNNSTVSTNSLLSYYDILQVSSDASETEIKSAHRKLAKQYHPDKNVGENSNVSKDQFIRIQEAYEVLSDSLERKRYNYCLKAKLPYSRLPIAVRATPTQTNENNNISRFSRAFYTQKRPAPYSYSAASNTKSSTNSTNSSPNSTSHPDSTQSAPSSPKQTDNNNNTEPYTPDTSNSNGRSNCSSPSTPKSCNNQNSNFSHNSSSSSPHSHNNSKVLQAIENGFNLYVNWLSYILLMFVLVPFRILSYFTTMAIKVHQVRQSQSVQNISNNNHIPHSKSSCTTSSSSPPSHFSFSPSLNGVWTSSSVSAY